MSKTKLGKRFSDEHKQRLSESHKGKKMRGVLKSVLNKKLNRLKKLEGV